jgi:hypothetical protein
VRTVREHAVFRTEKTGLSVLTGIINGQRRPWRNPEVKLEQPCGRDDMVLEGGNYAGQRGLYGSRGSRIRMASDGVVNAHGEITCVI